MTRVIPLVKYFLIGTALLVLTLAFGWWQVDGPGSGSKPPLRLSLAKSDFDLRDHNGNLVNENTLSARASLVFFGFTFCPDICPTTLAEISNWLNTLNASPDQLNAIFITVDPERDTSSVMRDYVSNFHPSIQGWTGTPSQIANVAAIFGVKYEKQVLTDGDYTMNHSAGVYLFDATGKLAGIIDIHEEQSVAIAKIERLISN